MKKYSVFLKISLSVILANNCPSLFAATNIALQANTNQSYATSDQVAMISQPARRGNGFAAHLGLKFPSANSVLSLSDLQLASQNVKTLGGTVTVTEDISTGSVGGADYNQDLIWITNIDCSSMTIVVDTHAVSGFGAQSGQIVSAFGNTAGVSAYYAGQTLDNAGYELNTPLNVTGHDTGISVYGVNSLQLGLIHSDSIAGYVVDVVSPMLTCFRE